MCTRNKGSVRNYSCRDRGATVLCLFYRSVKNDITRNIKVGNMPESTVKCGGRSDDREFRIRLHVSLHYPATARLPRRHLPGTRGSR